MLSQLNQNTNNTALTVAEWLALPAQQAVYRQREAIAVELLTLVEEEGILLPYALATIIDIELSGFGVDLVTGAIFKVE